MLKSKESRYSVPLLIVFFLAAVLGILLIDKMGMFSLHSRKRQSKESALNPQLLEKARQKMAEDPTVLTNLSPDKKKKAEAAMKKYGISLP